MAAVAEAPTFISPVFLAMLALCSLLRAEDGPAVVTLYTWQGLICVRLILRALASMHLIW